MDFKAALQTQPPRSPATLFFFVIPFVTHVFDHTHICERALLHTEFAMASVRDFAHRIPVRCGKKSYQHGCRTAQAGVHARRRPGNDVHARFNSYQESFALNCDELHHE